MPLPMPRLAPATPAALPASAAISAGVAPGGVEVLAGREADRPISVPVLPGGVGDRQARLRAAAGPGREQGADRGADGELPVGELLTGVELVGDVERLDGNVPEPGADQRGAEHGRVGL